MAVLSVSEASDSSRVSKFYIQQDCSAGSVSPKSSLCARARLYTFSRHDIFQRFLNKVWVHRFEKIFAIRSDVTFSIPVKQEFQIRVCQGGGSFVIFQRAKIL